MASNAPELPPGYRLRAVDPAQDLAAVSVLFLACDVADHGKHEHQDAWIVETWRSDGLAGAWVVDHDGDDGFVAYAELETYDAAKAFDAYVPIHPAHRDGPLLVALLAFLEVEVQARMRGAEVALRPGAPAEAGYFRDAATDLGFEHVRTFWHMERALDPAEPTGDLPPGVTIRPSLDPEDDETVYRVLDGSFRGHFGIEPMTFEAWRSDFKDGMYDPSRVLIAEVDGEAAGVADSWVPDGIGWIGDLGVLERFRGRGIGTALLRHSFTMLAARGVTEVRLNVDAENETGATRLYASVGMTERRRFQVYEKRVRAAG